MPRPTRTSGIATAPWRERSASRGTWRGPRRCHDDGHPVPLLIPGVGHHGVVVWNGKQQHADTTYSDPDEHFEQIIGNGTIHRILRTEFWALSKWKSGVLTLEFGLHAGH